MLTIIFIIHNGTRSAVNNIGQLLLCFGAALSKLCKEELDALTVDKLESILAFANKAASITTSRHGAIPAMPTLAEVEG